MHQLFADVSSRYCKKLSNDLGNGEKKIIRMDRDLPSVPCRRKLISVVAVTFFEGDGISAARIQREYLYACICVCVYVCVYVRGILTRARGNNYHCACQPRLKWRMFIASLLIASRARTRIILNRGSQ